MQGRLFRVTVTESLAQLEQSLQKARLVSFFYECSHLDRVCFQQFLELLSQPWGDDLAVIQVDQATAHTAHSII